MELIDKILEWPVIIQGILGSFLFWVIFTIGQKIINLSTKKIKDENKLGQYFGKQARDNFYEDQYEFSNYNFFICLYGALHYFLKFSLFVFLSMIIKDFVPVFSYVGYLIALYFIFRALTYVTHFKVFEAEDNKNGRKHPIDEKIKKLDEEIQQLKK